MPGWFTVIIALVCFIAGFVIGLMVSKEADADAPAPTTGKRRTGEIPFDSPFTLEEFVEVASEGGVDLSKLGEEGLLRCWRKTNELRTGVTAQRVQPGNRALLSKVKERVSNGVE
jgi:hypothetical protein